MAEDDSILAHAIDRAPKTITALVGGAIADWAGAAVLHWLGLSMNGAVCGGVLVGLPMFLAIRGFLGSREMRRQLQEIEARIPRQQGTKITGENLHLVAATSMVPLAKAAPYVAPSDGTFEIRIPNAVARLRALGVVRDLKISQVAIRNRDGGQDVKFSANVRVDFYTSIDGIRPSPMELYLTHHDSVRRLAILKGTLLPTRNGTTIVVYSGTGPWDDLLGAAVPLPPNTERSRDVVFVRVALRGPHGLAGDAHRDSLMKLDFELSAPGFRADIVPAFTVLGDKLDPQDREGTGT